MKKTMIVLMFALASCNGKAFEDLQSVPSTSYKCVNNTCFLEPTCQARSSHIDEEYNSKKDLAELVVEIDEVDDYEQAISSTVQPPKISATQQILARVFGELLVRYISMREMTRIYLQELKAAVKNWYSQYITSA
jgi:Glu-tRNA(Gln) amidotransferase subunit E-like FAD-binding protein